GSDHRFPLRPLPAQTFLRGFLRVFRHFVKVRVNLRAFLRLQINLRQPRLVINWHGGLVFLRLQDVVNINDHGARQREYETWETNWWRAWEAKSPNTACVFLSPLSIGVPVKPMNDALGNA